MIAAIFSPVLFVGLFFLALCLCLRALSANAIVNTCNLDEPFELPVGAAVHIYRNAFVGKDPAGYAKAFVPGDEFVGLADEEADNSSGSAGAIKASILIGVPIVVKFTGVAQKDVGKPLYALSDDPTSGTGVALTGHPDAYIGRIVAIDSTSYAIVQLKRPGEKPPNGQGSIELVVTGMEQFSATGADGATHGNVYIGSPGGAFEGKSILGTGLSPVDAENGGITGTFDAVAEIALASLRLVHDPLPVDKGITFEADLVVSDSGDDAALDVDFGLGTALTTDSEADIDHAAMVQLACFHMDGGSDSILCQSDDNTTDVAPVDSTIENDSDTDVSKKFKIVVRPTGVVEFWIDGVRVLSSTSFAVLSTAALSAFVNMEKTADRPTTAAFIVRNLRVAGGCAA